VIIPTRDRPDSLKRTLNSIFRQSYEKIEVIVVDDGSESDISRGLEDYSIRKLVRQPHKGANAARNNGFRHSEGELLLFCDDDAELEPRFLEKMVQALKQNPQKAYAYCGFEVDGAVLGMKPFDAEELKRQNYIDTISLIRRSRFPGFDPRIERFQDWDLWLTMLDKGYEGVWVPEVLYRKTAGNYPRISDEGSLGGWTVFHAYRVVAEKHKISDIPRVFTQRFVEPMDRLIEVYTSRPDLQSAFPEGMRGEYLRLLQWARDWLATGRDWASTVLMSHAQWYKDNEWIRLADELNITRTKFTQRESTIQTLQAEKTTLTNELNLARTSLTQRESTIQTLETDRSSLVRQLGEAKRELLEIRHSLGYKVMRFYGSHIDQLLPDGTSRGVLRKRVVTNLRTLAERPRKLRVNDR